MFLWIWSLQKLGADAVLQVVFYFPCCIPDPILLVKPLGCHHLAVKIFYLFPLLLFPLALNSTVVSHTVLFPPFAPNPQPPVLLIFLTPREGSSTLSSTFLLS